MKEGERISLRGVWDGDEEARTIGEEIEALQRDKHALSQMAILVRAGFQTREFEERFITMGLPYRVIGGRASTSARRSATRWPTGRVTVQPGRRSRFRAHLQHAAPRAGRIGAAHPAADPARQKVSLFEATRRALETDELKARARKTLGDLSQELRSLARQLVGMNTSRWSRPFWTNRAYTDMLRADRSPEAPGRLENLKELTKRAAGSSTPCPPSSSMSRS